jgi:hypothetical protein
MDWTDAAIPESACSRTWFTVADALFKPWAKVAAALTAAAASVVLLGEAS